MATISTSGIISGSIIRAEHVTRIINALSSKDDNDILISGSLGVTGSVTIESSSISNVSNSEFILSYNTGSGDVGFTARVGTSGT